MSNIIEVIHYGNDHLEPIKPVCEEPVHGFPKPDYGGLWTSPVDSSFNWRDWCELEDFAKGRLSKSFRLTVCTDTLLIIDSWDDLMQKMVHPGLMREDRDGLTCIYWGEILKKYNGIWLTRRGVHDTRFSYPYNLYGWDCETVFLFNEKPIVSKH